MVDAATIRGEWTVPARRLNIGQATETVLAVAGAAGYSTVATGPASFRLARTYRPKWATITAIATAVFCGLGLLFLLAKTTEIADVQLVDERDGVKARIAGSVSAAFLSSLQAKFVGAGDPAPSAGFSAAPTLDLPPQAQASVAPSDTGPSWTMPSPSAPQGPLGMAPTPIGFGIGTPVDTDHTVIASRLPAQPVDHAPVAFTLRFASGDLLAVGAGLVIGRDPADDPALPGAARVAISDMSISKTHLSVGSGPTGVWVVDRFSTNGTMAEVQGSTQQCDPGVAVTVPAGGRVRFGDLSFTVEQG